MGKFANDCQAWADDVPKKVSIAVRWISLELFKRIVYNTPVDTGRARGNWQVGVDSAPTSSLLTVDKAGGITVSQGRQIINQFDAERNTSIFLVNNLVYIVPLEDGHSKQAPRGMVGNFGS